MRRALPAALAALVASIAIAAAAWASHDLTELQSTGPAGGNGAVSAAYAGASEDGTRLFFQTIESLVAGDTDGRMDVYERSAGTTVLVSTGSPGGNGPFAASFAGASSDGARVFFTTAERLLPSDSDSQTDVYERAGGVTTLISAGVTGGNGSFGAFFDGAASDGSHVFFHTNERLVAADTDFDADIYDRVGGTTLLISAGAVGAGGSFPAFFGGASGDGAHVFFESQQALTADDTDNQQDVFERFGATTVRSSKWNDDQPGIGNGAFDAFYNANSEDGQRVIYSTEEALAAGDCDDDQHFDIYDRTSGNSSLRSATCSGSPAFDAHFAGASPDVAGVWFETEEQMRTTDTDSNVDVYQHRGSIRHVSAGPAGGNGAFDAQFAGAARDSLEVYFETEESLVSADADDRLDVYEYDSGAGFPPPPTELVSTGPTGGNGAFDARFEGASDDGSRAFFSTDEPLAGTESDARTDVYERQSPVTTLQSTGPSGGNGAFDAQYAGQSEDGGTMFFSTVESLVGGDTDANADIYARRDSAGYARPRGATPLRVSLVPSYQECTAPNRTHGPPLAFPSCAAPVQRSSQLTVGTFDANGVPPESVGSVRLDVVPASTEDPTDVRVTISITDVRRSSDNSDYTGEVAAFADLRLTDRGSGPSGSEPATMSDIGQRLISVSCGATPGAAGATCAGFTTLNAILPGSVSADRRAIWQLGDVTVTDGGPDGDVDTAPNGTFARQGIFVP